MDMTDIEVGKWYWKEGEDNLTAYRVYVKLKTEKALIVRYSCDLVTSVIPPNKVLCVADPPFFIKNWDWCSSIFWLVTIVAIFWLTRT